MQRYFLNGWCPFGTIPYKAKDGLFLRIIPNKSYLSLEQSKCICEISKNYGNSKIDITNRGNLQIRGLKKDSVDKVVLILETNNLIPNNIEKLIINPFWDINDGNVKIYKLIKKNFINFPL